MRRDGSQPLRLTLKTYTTKIQYIISECNIFLIIFFLILKKELRVLKNGADKAYSCE